MTKATSKRQDAQMGQANFGRILRGVLLITIGAGLLQVVLAGIWYVPTAVQLSVIESMDFAWKAGIGAIFGLLGGEFART